MNKNRILSFAMILLVLSMLAGCVASEKIPIPTVLKDIYIYDEDDIIDDTVEKKLNKLLVDLEQKTEAEFTVISIESLLERSIEDYANNLFNTLGIGKKGKDNGVLLLFSRSDTRVRLEIGKGLEGCLNDAKCGRILDNYFVPYRETDEYTKATEMTVKAVLSVIAEEYEITIDGLDVEAIQIDKTSEDSSAGLTDEQFLIIIAIIIGALILEWITGHIFGDGFGDGIVFAILSSSSSSGSSFRGGSSGGGFGGGSSGGGGASR